MHLIIILAFAFVSHLYLMQSAGGYADCGWSSRKFTCYGDIKFSSLLPSSTPALKCAFCILWLDLLQEENRFETPNNKDHLEDLA
jgi:hypothetical protein